MIKRCKDIMNLSLTPSDRFDRYHILLTEFQQVSEVYSILASHTPVVMSRAPDASFFIPNLSMGGAQRVTLNIANGLAERGFNVDLLIAYPDGELRSELDENVELVNLDVPLVPGVGLLAGVPHVRSYFRRAKPDVFISTMTFVNVVTLLSTFKDADDTRIVLAEHDTFGMPHGTKVRLTQFLARYLYPRADQVIAVSEGVAQSVVAGTRITASAVSVIHNPIDVEAIRDEAAAPVDHPWLNADELSVILGVGRMARQKDFPTLIHAMDRLRSQRGNVRLIIAGEGAALDELRELVTRLELDDVVDLPGYVENVYAYLGHADVFALSSIREGLPTVLIEALACGTPVVSTDCPSGPREILDDGAFGPLVPVGDPQALAVALEETLSDPLPPSTLRSRSDDFAPEVAIDNYAALIDGYQ
jgi:glycosyltransferase involved in cell wall biosynthesis